MAPSSRESFEFVRYFFLRKNVRLSLWIKPNLTFFLEKRSYKVKALLPNHSEKVVPKLPFVGESDHRYIRLVTLGYFGLKCVLTEIKFLVIFGNHKDGTNVGSRSQNKYCQMFFAATKNFHTIKTIKSWSPCSINRAVVAKVDVPTLIGCIRPLNGTFKGIFVCFR